MFSLYQDVHIPIRGVGHDSSLRVEARYIDK